MSSLSQCHSIQDLRLLAQKKVPSVVFDYMDGGAEAETTLNWNREAFNRYEFVPRVLRDVHEIDLSTIVQGIALALPIISAPTGFTRMFHYEGELAVVRAAHDAGSAFCLSMVGNTSIEEVAAASQGPKFFQIYAWHDRNMTTDFINRCKTENYDGLMLAVDLATLGKRERDLRHGHGTPKLKRSLALAALKRPRWLYHFLTKPTWRMGNMLEHLPDGAKTIRVIDKVNEQFDPSVSWEDAREMQQAWGGNFILKGIQSVADAVKAAEMGATGIVLSNHGGRQLDGAPAMLDILPEVVAEVGTKTEVLMDGGIERGADIIKAVALGARAVLIGKAYLYGLAAGGQKGVAYSYAILRDEMVRVMQLIGCTSIKDLDVDYVRKRL